MSKVLNPFLGHKVEYHILQSFPVSCLNRDDVGAPKSAMIGGTQRARVSSQCWKRQVRLKLHEQGISIGVRTKLIMDLIANECAVLGATEEQAKDCGATAANFFGGVKEGTSDTLMFISQTEAKAVAKAFYEIDFALPKIEKGDKKQTKDEKKESKVLQLQIDKIMNAAFNPAFDGVDIALFGRMVASAPSMNVEAASSFAHAISTHKISNEVEFFTALDDNKTEQGSAHMGSLEFNAATYYRYVSLNLGQLWENLSGNNIPETVEAFTKALFLAVPSARQTTMSSVSPWDFAKITVRKGQGLQVPFEKAVYPDQGSILVPSRKVLTDYLSKHEKLWGSLFGEIAEIEYGESKTIDDVLEFLKTNTTKN